ncbi:MAG: hypothetical protein LBC85_10770 [Fibromonadaceae bacterium]|jgi:hypothetical protein|nr:hypothetical protein [Fibromonadaceae bacterium]
MKNYFFTLCLILLCLSVMGCGWLDGEDIKIKYEVTGTASSVYITMHNANGSIEELSDVSVPWSKELIAEGVFDGCFYPSYISAQNNGSSGSITVKIYKDGKEIQTATSIGAYVTATASKETRVSC